MISQALDFSQVKYYFFLTIQYMLKMLCIIRCFELLKSNLSALCLKLSLKVISLFLGSLLLNHLGS